ENGDRLTSMVAMPTGTGPAGAICFTITMCRRGSLIPERVRAELARAVRRYVSAGRGREGYRDTARPREGVSGSRKSGHAAAVYSEFSVSTKPPAAVAAQVSISEIWI